MKQQDQEMKGKNVEKLTQRLKKKKKSCRDSETTPSHRLLETVCLSRGTKLCLETQIHVASHFSASQHLRDEN